MAKYRKKPVVIEAFRFGHDKPPVWWKDAVDCHNAQCTDNGEVAEIATLEGTMSAYSGDYIIRGVQGELYPCRADIFNATYEMVEA